MFQTLEPRAYYLAVPSESKPFPIFDTSQPVLILINYLGITVSVTIDGDANQLTLCLKQPFSECQYRR